MRGRPIVWILFVLAGLAAFPAGALAQAALRVRAAIDPSTARLGERVTYRGIVVLEAGAGPSTIRWTKPDDSASMVWGTLTPHYRQGGPVRRTGSAAHAPAPVARDTAFVSVPLQVFETGLVAIPGLEFEVQLGSQWIRHRLPVVYLPIVPVLSAADSNADLRPLRGPLGAPWWEKVPWTIVLGILLAIVLAWLIWKRLRRRKPRVVAAPARAQVREDPVTEALRELSALRRLQLPDEGRFADHALALTKILKRFLERTRTTPRPGDTTPELVRHLKDAGFSDEETRRVETLLRFWDRLKFARGRAAIDEAREAEHGVESLVRAARAATRPEAA